MICQLSVTARSQKRKKIILAALIIAAFIFLAGGFWQLANFEKFKIKKIVIEGAERVSKRSLSNDLERFLKKKFLKIFPLDNIFFVSKKEIKSFLLRRYPQISEVAVDFKFSPPSLYLKIKERKPKAILCNFVEDEETIEVNKKSEEGNKKRKRCFFIDKTGFVFEEAPYFYGSAFLKIFNETTKSIKIGDLFLSRSENKKIFNFCQEIKRQNLNCIEIHLKPLAIWEIYINGGLRLIISEGQDWQKVYLNLVSFLNNFVNNNVRLEDLEYIDLRFDNKIFYKIKTFKVK